MKIEIEVTATNFTLDEFRRSKRFVTRVETPDGAIKHIEGHMSEVEERVLESIFCRIRQDKDNLINWHKEGGVVSAMIEIIPAIDYIPE